MNDTTVNDGAKNVTTWEIYEIQLNTGMTHIMTQTMTNTMTHNFKI